MNLPGPSSLAARGATPGGGTERVPQYAWVVLIVLFLLSMSAPLNQFKAPPVMPLLRENLGLSLSGGGLLMSAFAITGIFLALPAGFILQRLGLKTTGLIAGVCLVAGAAMGALSQSSALLLASRFVEGMGTGFMSVTAPAAIAAWFPPQSRGVPMGIWAAWVPAGSLSMFLAAPPLAASGGWRAVWWFGLIFAAVATLLYGLFMRQPPQSPAAAPDKTDARNSAPLQALSNRQIWLLALVFACFTYVMLAIATFFPTYLIEQRQFSVAAAANVLALNNVAVLFSAPLFGWLSDRQGTLKRYFTFPFLFLLLMIPIIFQLGGSLIMPTFFLMGAITSAIPTTVVAAAPELLHNPRLVGMAMAVLTIGQNLGMVAGPAVFGRVAEQSGWLLAMLSLLPILLLGFLTGRHVRVR